MTLSDDSNALVLSSNFGIGAFPLTEDGLNLDSSFFLEFDPILSVNPTSASMGPGALLLLGNQGGAHTTRINSDQGRLTIESPTAVEALEQILSSRNATGTVSLHLDRPGDTPLLLVGTDSGLIRWITNDLSETFGSPLWVYTEENAESFVGIADLLNSSKSSVVNVLEPAGILTSNGEIGQLTGVWLGTPSGIHFIDIEDLFLEPTFAISNDRMFNPDTWLSGGNDVLSVEQIPGMLLIGSRDGLWALEGDGSGILGMIDPPVSVSGPISDVTSWVSDGQRWFASGIEPGKFEHIPNGPNFKRLRLRWYARWLGILPRT